MIATLKYNEIDYEAIGIRQAESAWNTAYQSAYSLLPIYQISQKNKWFL